MKWVEIAVECNRPRYELLSEEISRLGHKNSVEFMEVSPVDFGQALDEALAKYDSIRVGRPYGVQVVESFDGQLSTMMSLGAADAIMRKDGRWVLGAAALHGLYQVISDIGHRLDLQSSILVIGAGAGARMACGAFVRSGFNHIIITNKFVEQGIELIRDLRRSYFDVNFEFIPPEQLVLLPGKSGALINTTPLVPTNDILAELYYFNFLKSGGVVLDFTQVPPETPLVKEAKAVEIEVVAGYEIASYADAYWTQWTLGLTLDRKTYVERLYQAFLKVDFDLSPFITE